MRICVDPSPAGVRCWYPLTKLYVRICDVYMWHCALINFMYVISNDFKMWLHMYKVIHYLLCGIIIFDIIEWVVKKKKIKILVLFLTLFCCVFCIITYWMCGLPHQLQFFKLKFSWGTEPLDCFVRCKVECGSFRWSQ